MDSRSARIDTQGERIEVLVAKLGETRTAAVTATGRTDHRAYAKLMGRAVDEVLGPVLEGFAEFVRNLEKEHEATTGRLKELKHAGVVMLERRHSKLG